MKSVPTHWKLCKLGDVIRLKNGYAFKSNDYTEDGIPLIRISDINDNKVTVDSAVRIPREKANADFYIESGDLLIAMSGATTGKTGVYNGRAPILQNQRVGNFKIIDENILDKRYRNYYVASLRKDIEKAAYGGAQPNISSKGIESFDFPLAPIDEQKLIVSEIEKQFSRLDEAVAALKRVRAGLKRYKASVLKAAVEGKLTEEWRKRRGEKTSLLQKQGAELPEGWVCAKLDEVAEINPKSPKNIPDNVEVSFLPMKLVQEETGVIDLSITKKFGEVKRGYTSFINNDIIFAKITPCMENGKIAIVENLKNGLGFGSTEFHVIRLHEPKSNKYLFYFLLQRDIRKQAQRNMTGTAGQLRVPAKFMQEISVSLPPISEQLKIVEEIESRLSVAEEVEEAIDINLKRAERLRQAILKKAFSGRLVEANN